MKKILFISFLIFSKNSYTTQNYQTPHSAVTGTCALISTGCVYLTLRHLEIAFYNLQRKQYLRAFKHTATATTLSFLGFSIASASMPKPIV